MNNQKGVAHLLLLLFIVALIGGAGFLFYKGYIKLPSFGTSLFQKKVQVEIKKEYKNPFKKETQYVNPFDKYKNPFVVNR